MKFGTKKLTTFFATVAFAAVLTACGGLDHVLNAANRFFNSFYNCTTLDLIGWHFFDCTLYLIGWALTTDARYLTGLILAVAICGGEAGQLADSWRKWELARQLRKGNQARSQPSDSTL